MQTASMIILTALVGFFMVLRTVKSAGLSPFNIATAVFIMGVTSFIQSSHSLLMDSTVADSVFVSASSSFINVAVCKMEILGSITLGTPKKELVLYNPNLRTFFSGQLRQFLDLIRQVFVIK